MFRKARIESHSKFVKLLVLLLDGVGKVLDAGEDYGKVGCGLHLHQDLHWDSLLNYHLL